ncbi:MAG: transposase [Candidatus Aminicenantes bacterium]|nr:transposase [Candidatus Aminicenantes bacterium]
MEHPHAYFDHYGEVAVTANRLPHWQQDNVLVFVTWRLGDSLPQTKLDQWKEERKIWLKRHPRPWDVKTAIRYHKRFSRRIEDWLDRGSGSCVLKAPALANMVADALRHFDGERYELVSFVVMPNHVHVLFRPLGSHAIPKIVKSWKWFTARKINKKIGTSGRFWQEDYWDRLIRHPLHFSKCVEYIRENPTKAGLSDGQFLLFERFRRGDILVPHTLKNRGLKTPSPTG